MASKVDGSQFTKGVKAIFKLPGGQLYYDSALELDSDGSRFAAQDRTGQSDTSLHQPDGSPVDADTVPFFVLPLGGFRRQFGIELGDIAAVLHRDQVEFAVFADMGPPQGLGEGSIALHRSLGHETIRGGRFHDEGIDRDVITIVFPGSGDGTPQTPERVREVGRKLFQELGGNVE
ncbi:MAG: glycoside hydrolase family 75 protein [Thermoanaerobaculia bacterium]